MAAQRIRRTVSRRELLWATGAGFGAFSLAGCELLSTDPESDRPAGAKAAKGPEAPALAKLVEAGDLPRVRDRLPAAPLVVQPVERIGVYGGTWRSVLLGPSDTAWVQCTIGYEGLMRWDPGWTKVVPNVAESVEASPDAREFVIGLRKGMRWSDGEPFTADDLVFAHQYVLLDKDLYPVPGSWLVHGGRPATLEKVDDHTVRMRFAVSSGMFMTDLARIETSTALVDKPFHYLKQFHRRHNRDADKLAKQEGFASWTELFGARVSDWSNTEKPTLNAWTITTPIGEWSRVVARRNPYYWKTDPDGSQLPYIDEVVYEVISDPQAILLKATNGEFDLVMRHVNSLPNKPVLAKARESGKFDFVKLRTSYMNEMVISLNLAHKDPVKRKIFQTKDFRIGLSHAINRDELSTAVFQRQGEAWQAAPNPESEFYDEEMAKQYTEFDVTLAKSHLDKAGLTKKDSDGFRLGPDGKRVSIVVEVALPALVPFWVDAMSLVVEYWKAVGIDARVKTEDRALYDERTRANEHDAGVWNGTGGYGDEILGPLYYFPVQTALVAWATPWGAWYAARGKGAGLETPPEAPRKQIELYWKLLETPADDDRKAIFREILRIAKEQFYTIGTIRIPEGYATVSHRLHNVPEVIPDSYRYATPAPTNPAQFFLES